jgi:Ribbon-helix-helix protein, copG family
MHRTQIQIEEEQMEWLRSKARARGVSLSQLIREGIKFYRAHEEQLPENRKRKALEAVGRFSSGTSDVSEHHDDYLADAYKTEARNGN